MKILDLSMFDNLYSKDLVVTGNPPVSTQGSMVHIRCGFRGVDVPVGPVSPCSSSKMLTSGRFEIPLVDLTCFLLPRGSIASRFVPFDL